MSYGGLLGLATAIIALAVPVAAAASQAGQLEAELGPGVTVSADAETGRQVTFIGTDSGVSIPLSAEAPRAAALEVADRFGAAFGLRDDSDLEISDLNRTDGGRSAIRLQQTIDGVPVLGGQLSVDLDASGDLLSVVGELEPGKGVETDPAVSEAEADDAAFAFVSKTYGLSPDELEVAGSELSVYDPRILGGPGLEIPRLVWRFEVVGRDGSLPIREFVLVDAEEGNVALSFDNIHEAKNRAVCDDANNSADDPDNDADGDFPCEAGGYARLELAPPTGVADVDAAYDFSGGVFDYYMSNFGRDSIDGAGMSLISTARYCPLAAQCPYANAFWNGTQMTYGAGVVTDDIAAHELTHGVTEFDSNLFYYYQSGAINESISDVFGEFYDFVNVDGLDTPANRWRIGEGSALGVIRDMEHPPNFSDPDRMTSPLYVFNPDTNPFAAPPTGDNGGVHSNSGVNNKATFLLTDGGTFNGHTVSALGATKVARLYYDVNANRLNSASDYQDLANAMRQSCATLAAAGTAGFTTADCTEVNDATLATVMDQEPTNAAAPEADTCTTPGTSPVDVFFDDMENTASGNWVETGSGQWFYPSSLVYARSGVRQLRSQATGAISDSQMTMSSSVTIPPDGLMHFSHAYGFESTGPSYFDGGVLEYSVGAGPFLDAGPLFAQNGYPAAINAATNPLNGRQAFVGESKGYTSARLDLSSLAGQNVRFRFRQGTDLSIPDYGWFVDDVRIYSCRDITAPETTITGGPADGETTTETTFAYTFSSDDPAATFECSSNGGAFSACTSPLNFAGVADGPYTTRVRAVDAAGNTDASPASRTLIVDTRCPRAQSALVRAVEKLKKAKKRLKKAKLRGAPEEKIERLKKKAKKAKKAVRKAKAAVAAVCV